MTTSTTHTMTRRDAILTGAGLAAGLLLTPAAARAARPSLLRSDAETFFPWQELAPGIQGIADPATGGNTLLVTSKGQGLLSDTKFPAIGKALVREGQHGGVKLRYAVNTHHHGDHTGGNHAFNTAGITLVAHKKAEPRILDNMQQYIGGVTGGTRFVGALDRPTQALVLDEAGELSSKLATMDVSDWGPTELMPSDEYELKVGDAAVLLHHFGRASHTDNDVIVRVNDNQVIHTGDLVFSGLHPYFDPTAGVTARGWIATLREVRALCKPDTVVLPGHGAVGGPGVIDAQRAYLERLIEAVQKEIDAGKTGDETAEMSWEFMNGLGFEQVRARAIRAVYNELKGDD